MTMWLNGLPIREVGMDEQVTYRCDCCGDCCRHVKDAIMLESIDLCHLARHFNIPASEVIDRYASAVPLDESGYPIFLLNTAGPDDACVFLRNNRCTVQAAKPRACRLYPFTAGPGKKGRELRYYLCLEKPRHFTAGQIRVGSWLREHFSDEDRLFMTGEYDVIPELSKLLRSLPQTKQKRAMTSLLFFRYLSFDPMRPFLPQYAQNNRELMQALQYLASEKEEIT